MALWVPLIVQAWLWVIFLSSLAPSLTLEIKLLMDSWMTVSVLRWRALSNQQRIRISFILTTFQLCYHLQNRILNLVERIIPLVSRFHNLELPSKHQVCILEWDVLKPIFAWKFLLLQVQIWFICLFKSLSLSLSLEHCCEKAVFRCYFVLTTYFLLKTFRVWSTWLIHL